MREDVSLITCVGCGALVPDIEGPTHRYIGASPECWKIYSDMLGTAYSGDVPWMPHRLAVDVYAAQHPGVPGKQSSQSVAAHLFVLCLVLEHGVDPSYATRAISQFLDRHKGQGFEWVEPTASLGDLTVLEIVAVKSQVEHNLAVMKWAESVWHAWEVYHAKVRRWAEDWVKSNSPG